MAELCGDASLRGVMGVAVMQSADVRYCDDAARSWRLDLPWLRAVLPKTEVRPRFGVLGDVLAQHATEMPLVQDDHVIEALAPDRSDQSFDARVLPR